MYDLSSAASAAMMLCICLKPAACGDECKNNPADVVSARGERPLPPLPRRRATFTSVRQRKLAQAFASDSISADER